MKKATTNICVLDFGLTNCKSVVFSGEGKILRSTTASYKSYTPFPGYLEQDPEQWWQVACQATRSLWEADPDLSKSIGGISVTGQMHALVCLDRRGEPIGKAIVLGDQRSIEEANFLVRELGMQQIYQITGARMDASVPAAKIRWLKKHASEIHRKVDLYLGCKDYIRKRLCGDRCTDPTDACATSLYDLQNRCWSAEMIKAVGIDADKLPEIKKSAELAGTLLRIPAQALGLKEGIPIVIGGGDDVSVLGSGIIAPGISMENIGTTGAIMCCSDRPLYDPNMALELYPHAEPGLWVLGGAITTAGSALAWVTESLKYRDLKEAFSALDSLGNSPDGESLIFIPHLRGERCPKWEPKVRAAWIGLSSTHTRSDLMVAAFEGVVFALRLIVDRLADLGVRQEFITVRQRSTNDERWLRLRSNIYVLPLGISNTSEPSALGAMALAGVGIGLFANLREALAKLCRVERKILPNEEDQAGFRQRYLTYRRDQSILLPLWRNRI